ncbi:alpha/beta hydrolase domain-containing protein [Methylocystis heyeri]|uniref:Alpha/beta hydrolase domain-containing protein n=1 Tax=Methylocystis heyeri TaxID=391905 RepID=A0A6B8KLF8_9HYPH|nr:alpha/beta hydrolase domain-containing protein [Methylocystis heyeri]QGM47670.1 hypothetical protein H2LOC_019425 [Methylocystis heyeri]
MKRVALASAAIVALFAGAAAAQAQPAYGPPPPPALPDGYQRELVGGAGVAGPRFLIWKPPAPSGVLLVVAGEEPSLAKPGEADILQAARERSMAILFAGDRPEGAGLPETIADLRRSPLARKVVGAGAGEDYLRLESKSFDALLLAGGQAPAAAKGPPFIVYLYGSEGFWKSPPQPQEPDSKAPNRRSFFIAGATLSAGAHAENCAAPINDRSIDPARRALLAALDEYLRKGVAVPASRPAVLVPVKELHWPKIPGLPPPQDAGLAPPIDADGNETSGLLLPDQALPIATFTGWNAPRDPAKGKCAAGTKLPFPENEAARRASGDPRQSLPERYGSRAYFVAALRSVADRLVKERLLLPQDADAYVAAGKKAPF